MMAALAHRGPDDEGLRVAPAAVVGMRRLSIIDLAGGAQPMANEDGTVWVVLNGEIYNFQELRGQLEATGHVFRTQSDTEAIVHAYEEWGPQCVQRLRGMFAFAVVKADAAGAGGAEVFLARDRFGIKPLYYAEAEGSIAFASEVRALVASGLVPPRLSAAALESYLLFGSVGEPLTLVEGVRSLPPGHRLLLSASRPAAEPEPYWKPGELGAEESPGTAGESPATRLRSLLEETVRLHLIADVPLGVFLSSGIDSTALAALAGRLCTGVNTFTVSFREQEYSEALLARKTAEALGTTHREFLLDENEMLERIGEAVAGLDQPSMDGINTYFVSWATRQSGLKVALSGLGGDEIFGGYSTFRSTPHVGRVAAVARRLPQALRSATAPAVAALAEARAKPDAARKLASVWREPEALPEAFFFTRMLFPPEQVSRLLREDRPWSEGREEWLGWLEGAAEEAERVDDFTAVSWLEARSYMVNTLLRDTDSMSMAHSLEVRVPFLDHALFESVATLPESVKRGSRPKALLVEALRDLLPAEVVAKTKQTFTLPWERWLRGALKETVAKGLTDLAPTLSSQLETRAVVDVWQNFLDERTSWSRPWSLYVLNEWARRHLSG